jgi:hypothetical protein
VGDNRGSRSEGRSRRHWLTIAVAGFAVVVTASGAVAQELGYSVSVSTARTDLPAAAFAGLYVFNSVDAGRGPLRVTLSVPWLKLHTSTEAAQSPIDGSEFPATDTSAAGFGDPLARVDVRIVDRPASAVQIGVAGAAKFPVVAPETGRGTGEFDAAFGATAYKGLGRTSVMLDALYWKFGDPEDVEFADTLSYSLAVGRMLGGTGRWSTMVSLSGFSAGYDGLSPPVLVNVALLRLIARQQSLSLTASIGVTESATDFSLAASWRITK